MPVTSLLDTDLYKLTMQQVVHRAFPRTTVAYRFTNRRPTDTFTRASFDWFTGQVARLAELRLTETERAYLSSSACPFFSSTYLDFLAELRLDPASQVTATFVPASASSTSFPGDDPGRPPPPTGPDGGETKKNKEEEKGRIELVVRGRWAETILYEVPLMALLSEAFFRATDVDWSIEGVKEKARSKASALLAHGIVFSEFGTRRRRSSAVHDLVLEGLLEASTEAAAASAAAAAAAAAAAGSERDGRGAGTGAGAGVGAGARGRLAGTSNVERAMRYGLTPVGTVAHELFMGIGALQGYADANARVMDLWEQVYPPSPTSTLHIALTDTFTTAAFFASLSADRARRWRGLRHDSGDAVEFARRAQAIYASLGIDPADKTVVFSDGLDVERCIAIKAACDALGLGASFGVGTFFTNDFAKASNPTEPSPALNIVIKLAEIDGHECVKLSDEPTKNSGSEAEVARVRRELGLTSAAATATAVKA